MKFTSLQQRLIILLLLPVALIISGLGLAAFYYARGNLLDQWEEAAVLRLERAAHYIDMRLAAPMDMMALFADTGGQGSGALQQAWLLDRIRALKGVTEARLLDAEGKDLALPEPGRGRGGMGMARLGEGSAMMAFRRSAKVEVSQPRLDPASGRHQVFLRSDLLDDQNRRVGSLEVAVSFDYLLSDMTGLGWWQSDRAALVTAAGRILSGTDILSGRTRLGQDGKPFELATLKAMTEHKSGTLRSPGHPAIEVSGWYRLSRAPWRVVLFAPGREILAPIVRFRDTFLTALAASVVLILLLIRLTTNRTVRAIGRISEAVSQVAEGDYETRLEEGGADELGRLAEGVNRMTAGLAERRRITNTFGRYVDADIVSELLANPETAKLGGAKRTVAILFSDIRDFTAISENLSPEETIALLNGYLSAVIEVIREHQGIIVDFLGDGLLAFFDPLGEPVQPVMRRAVDCALAMQRAMERFNQGRGEPDNPAVHLGIGLNCGPVIVGNIGSETRTKYGVVGLEVNLTARIQAQAEAGQVVMSEQAVRETGPGLGVIKTFAADLKGITGSRKLMVIKDLKNI